MCESERECIEVLTSIAALVESPLFLPPQAASSTFGMGPAPTGEGGPARKAPARSLPLSATPAAGGSDEALDDAASRQLRLVWQMIAMGVEPHRIVAAIQAAQGSRE